MNEIIVRNDPRLRTTDIHTAIELNRYCIVMATLIGAIKSDQLTHAEKRAVAITMEWLTKDMYEALLTSEEVSDGIPY